MTAMFRRTDCCTRWTDCPLAGWFVMVKDNVGRFQGHKPWGDGWGWAWFEATDSQKTTSTDYTADCKSCHLSARASDWIYTRGYPPLNR